MYVAQVGVDMGVLGVREGFERGSRGVRDAVKMEWMFSI